MVKYRQRLEIMASIIGAANNGAKKTRIMYVANLSYKLLKKYLDEAIRIGLIRYNNDTYEVAEKGRIFLDRHNRFSSKYSRLKRELEAMRFEREVLERMCALEDDVYNKPNTAKRKRT